MSKVDTAVDMVCARLLGDASIPLKIRTRADVSDDEVQELFSAIDFLTVHYADKDTVPKRLALAFVDVYGSFSISEAFVGRAAMERFEDIGIALQDKADALFSSSYGARRSDHSPYEKLFMNIDAELQRIASTPFFSKLGCAFPGDDALIRIESLRKAFVEPVAADFKGGYSRVEWLPTSPTQDDPFYQMPKSSADLAALRMQVNKAVMAATRNLDPTWFVVDQHDFSNAARGGICFAFRQYVSEGHLGLGDKWKQVVDIYYTGHWPIGVAAGKLVLV